jgi:hypothetical protein
VPPLGFGFTTNLGVDRRRPIPSSFSAACHRLIETGLQKPTDKNAERKLLARILAPATQLQRHNTVERGIFPRQIRKSTKTDDIGLQSISASDRLFDVARFDPEPARAA